MSKPAVTDAPLHPLLAERWSPRSFDRSHALAPSDVRTLLEAARWAPSSMNVQPWRFAVGLRGDDVFAALTDALGDSNRRWAADASALVLVVAETADAEGTARGKAVYDTGGAVAHLVAQATALGLSVHQMGGFDGAAASRAFDLEERLAPQVVLAVGRRAAADALPDDLAERERSARTRKPVDELLLPVPAALRRSA